jgi:hypothetical protein
MADLKDILALVSQNKHANYKPGPVHEQFHVDDWNRRLLRAPNQAGKTEAGTQETWDFLTESTRFKSPLPHHQGGPLVGIALAASHKSKRDVVGRSLWDSAPKHLLKPRSVYTHGIGWRNDIIEMKNGNLLFLHSAEEEPTSLAGIRADFAWVDEPPKRPIYGELVSRLAVSNGPLYMTMTPIGRPIEFLFERIEGYEAQGIAPLEEWHQYVPGLNTHDLPWRTQASIDAQLGSYDRMELKQRGEGAWHGITSSRLIVTFTEDSLIHDVPTYEYTVILGVDHGERAGHEAVLLILVNFETQTIYVIDEYFNGVPTTPEMDVDGIKELLARNRMTLASVDLGIGDTNSLGKLGAGRSVNDEFQRLTGVPFKKPDKRAGSIDYSVRFLTRGFAREQIKIMPRCKRLINSLKHWDGSKKTENVKHFIDALRYAVTPILENFSEQGYSQLNSFTLDRYYR